MKNILNFFLLFLLVIFSIASCSGGGGNTTSTSPKTSCTSNAQCSNGQVCQSGNCIIATNSAPLPPTNLTATPGNTQVVISWSASASAWGYNIYYSTTSGGPYTKAGSAVTTTYTVTGLTNGTQYYFVVTATNSAGESSYSVEMQAILKLLAPINLTAIAGNYQVALNWNTSSGAISYNIYQSMTPGGPYTKVGSVTSSDDTITGLTNGLSYYFVVTAVNGTEETGYSNQAGVTLISGSPTNLSAIAGTGHVSLSWNATIGATSYNVYYSTTSGGPYGAVGTTTTTGNNVTGLSNGREYYFVVTAVNAGGESGYSNQASATPLSPPSNLTVATGNGFAELDNWNTVLGATSYNVYYSTTSGGPYSLVGITTTTGFYIKTGLSNGTEYYFVVTAVNAGGESGYSNEVSVIPLSPPYILTATAGDGWATLNWQASIGATAYYIYDSMTVGAYVEVGATTNTNYTITGLGDGITYYFVVVGENSSGVSSNSNVVSATPQAIPAPPTNLTATPVAGYNVTLNWSASSGATSYNIYQSTTSGGPYTKINSTTGLNYTVTGLTYGTTYYFEVTAVNGIGESGYSNQASTGPPLPPSNLKATAGDTQVTLNWNTSSNATSYNIYQSNTSSGPYAKVGTVTSTADTITGLINGDTYYFEVTAVNIEGESGYSNYVAVAPCISFSYSVGNLPVGIAIDALSNVWVTNNGDNTVTELSATGATLGTYSTFHVGPEGIAIDSSGNIWVTNEGNALNAGFVLEMSPSGSGEGGYYTLVDHPIGIAIDGSGYVWFVDNGRGVVTEINPSTWNLLVRYIVGDSPVGVAIDASGNAWVTNHCGNDPSCSSSGTVSELSPSPTDTTIGTYSTDNVGPEGIAIAASGNIWVVNSGSYPSYNGTVTQISPPMHGSTGTYAVGSNPQGIAIDNAGNIWVTNSGDNTVNKLSSTGTIIGTYAVGSSPQGIAIDSAGNVWVVNEGNNTVTKLVSIATGPQYFPCSYFTNTSCPQFQGGGNF